MRNTRYGANTLHADALQPHDLVPGKKVILHNASTGQTTPLTIVSRPHSWLIGHRWAKVKVRTESGSVGWMSLEFMGVTPTHDGLLGASTSWHFGFYLTAAE